MTPEIWPHCRTCSRGLATDPDSPFGGDEATAAIESLRQALAGVSALALSGLRRRPAPSQPDAWQMRCDFTTDGLGLLMTSRLVARAIERWAIVDARGQRAAAAAFRGDRELVSAALIVRLRRPRRLSTAGTA